ncbi:hypothetical protein L3V79_09375 [Thiotrichales bacterium 19S9-12]|nr:hypothetical protein [Thiotrichales bacterium 19S9-11]MCF6812568.1 hypothetical protein [Thiotrichales bacterium 19S9-12]
MKFCEFLNEVREGLSEASDKTPELSYIAFTIIGLLTDGAYEYELLNTDVNISNEALSIISDSWNYSDSACVIIMAALLAIQIQKDEVNDKRKKQNQIKISLLLTSAALMLSLTPIGLSSWGFAASTVVDTVLASMDFYQAIQSYFDFDYWLEERLYELDFLEEKIKDCPDSALELEKKLVFERDQLQQQIKDCCVNYVKNNKKMYTENNQHLETQNLINSMTEKNNLNNINKDSLKVTSFDVNNFSKASKENVRKVKKVQQEQIKKSGIKLAIKVGSMVGMTLLAVGACAHPVGLAITVGVAIGYLMYSFGVPAITKVYNTYNPKLKKYIASLSNHKKANLVSGYLADDEAYSFNYGEDDYESVKENKVLHKSKKQTISPTVWFNKLNQQVRSTELNFN